MSGQPTIYGIQSTAGAVSIRNEKGNFFLINKILKLKKKKIFQVSFLCKK